MGHVDTASRASQLRSGDSIDSGSSNPFPSPSALTMRAPLSPFDDDIVLTAIVCRKSQKFGQFRGFVVSVLARGISIPSGFYQVNALF